jgi:hypothetical protein
LDTVSTLVTNEERRDVVAAAAVERALAEPGAAAGSAIR